MIDTSSECFYNVSNCVQRIYLTLVELVELVIAALAVLNEKLLKAICQIVTPKFQWVVILFNGLLNKRNQSD